ncbi:hypothetical protein ARMSODRAFT_978876 [Armillaria solidipes]|uniref:Uncharacterized protein n=1 Tax=Armillaria solidipes TaxID=1076256 RepID=A0A2H3B113_9AGAR|nr:hypothetical protein ARMSODRAFT_978876 [Armillaria solidipes]
MSARLDFPTHSVKGYSLFKWDHCVSCGGPGLLPWMDILKGLKSKTDTSLFANNKKYPALWQREDNYGHFLTVFHGTFWVPNSDDGLALGGSSSWTIDERKYIVQGFNMVEGMAKSHPIIQRVADNLMTYGDQWREGMGDGEMKLTGAEIT